MRNNWRTASLYYVKDGNRNMELSQVLKENNKVAIAFSGGVDSAYLLYAAIASGIDAKGYYVQSAFQPRFEGADALRIARDIGADIRVLNADIMAYPEVVNNGHDRCYHCKKVVFSAIQQAALSDGYTVLFDGTNFTDDVNDRPGIRALKELSVRSPLRECRLTKADIRRLSREAGLFTWDKPSYACLATRIPTGTAIDVEMLAITERAEDYLFSLGFSDFRIRAEGRAAKIQLPKEQFEKLFEKRSDVINELKRYYSSVLLDLEAR